MKEVCVKKRHFRENTFIGILLVTEKSSPTISLLSHIYTHTHSHSFWRLLSYYSNHDGAKQPVNLDNFLSLKGPCQAGHQSHFPLMQSASALGVTRRHERQTVKYFGVDSLRQVNVQFYQVSDRQSPQPSNSIRFIMKHFALEYTAALFKSF